MPLPRWYDSLTARTISRGNYFTIGFLLTLIKQGLDRLVATGVFGRPWSPLSYAVTGEIGGLFSLDRDDQVFYATMLAVALPFLVVGVVLTVRRLRDAGWPLWLVVFFFAPMPINIVFFIVLCLVPSRSRRDSWNAGRRDRRARRRRNEIDGHAAPLLYRRAIAGDLDPVAGRRGGGLPRHVRPSRLRLEPVRRPSVRAADALGRDLWLRAERSRWGSASRSAGSGSSWRSSC